MAERETLSMWTVYEKPLDYPHEFVARRWVVGPGWYAPTDEVLRANTLEDLRGLLPKGLTRVPEHHPDEPQIREVWL